MTKQTRQSGVIAAAVLKLRVVEALGKLHLRRGRCRLGSDRTRVQDQRSGQDRHANEENESGCPPGKKPCDHQTAPLIKLSFPHQLGFPFGAGVGIA